MKKLLVLPSLLLIGLSAIGQNTSVGWDDVIDCNAAGEGTLRPRITMNGDGEPVVLWGRMGPMANYVATGTSTGFTPMVEVSAPGCMPFVADWTGSSIAAVGNTVWVVMKATPVVKENTAAVTPANTDDAAPSAVEYIYHIVQPGDTLWGIAQNYPGVTVDTIKELNSDVNLRSLPVGKKLKVGVQKG